MSPRIQDGTHITINNETEAYELALSCAMAEYDEMYAQLQKLNQRAINLRLAVRSLSGLLDREVAEKYMPRPQPTGPNPSGFHNLYTVHNQRNKGGVSGPTHNQTPKP